MIRRARLVGFLMVMLAVVLMSVQVVTIGESKKGAVEEWLKKAAEPYQGEEVTLITESTPSSIYYKEHQTKRFEELTGIDVRYLDTSWGEMYSKEITHSAGNVPGIDVYYVEQDAFAAYASKGWLVNLDEFAKEHPELAMPNFDTEDFCPFGEKGFTWRGDYYSYPMESFLKILFYRKDIYNNPEMKAAYKEEYGEEFKPPDTKKEYRRTAKFITENSKEILGEKIWGHGSQHKGVTGPYSLTETYWPGSGCFNWGINLNNWSPLKEEGGLMNSQACVNGLQFYMDMVKYAPPGMKSWTWDGVPDALATGKIAQGLVYAEFIGDLTDPDKSTVWDKLGVKLPPATPEVLEMAAEDKEIPQGKDAYLGYFDGGGFAIPVASEHQEAAFLYLQWLLRPEAGKDLADKIGTIIRDSALEALKGGRIDRLTGYITFYGEHNHEFAPNRVGQVQKALVEGPIQRYFHEVSAGTMTAEEACKKMASEIKDTLYTMGYTTAPPEE